MNRRKIKALLLFFAVLALFSCSKTDQPSVEYLPFQETEDGQWGMISMDGEILFKEEFKNPPTLVRDGRFFVKSKEGVWEMYEASEKPQKVGKDYSHISSFQDGVAIVAEKNKPVSLINTDGSTIKELKTIDGKEVDGVKIFSEGYAVFMTADSLWGVIDNKGNCVVKPTYVALNNCSDGKLIGIDKKYKNQYQNKKKAKYKYSIINTSGKVLFEINADKYEHIYGFFVDGKMPISVKKDGKESWGIIDDKGEVVVRPDTKYKSIGQVKGDKFTYSNGDSWGLMNIKGETLIRAKYDFLVYDEDNLLLAQFKNGDDYDYKYIDEKDNQIGKDKYVTAYTFSMFGGKHTLVKLDDKIYSIIDKDGNQIEGLPDIVDINLSDGATYIESDYVDLDKVVRGFEISADGLLGLTFNSTVTQAVAKVVKEGGATGDESHKAGTPYWYDFRNYISFSKLSDGVPGQVEMNFSGNLSKQTYRIKKVIDYEFWDYYYYHNEKIPTGYVWTSVKPISFRLTINNEGRMHGKMRDMLKRLIKEFSKFGKVYKQNDGAAILNLNNGQVALIAMQKDHVFANWGKIGSASSINIEKYNDVVEEEDSDFDYREPGGIDNDYIDYYDADSTVTVDTTLEDDSAPAASAEAAW